MRLERRGAYGKSHGHFQVLVGSASEVGGDTTVVLTFRAEVQAKECLFQIQYGQNSWSC